MNGSKHDPADPEDEDKYYTWKTLVDAINKGITVSFTVNASKDAWKLINIAEPSSSDPKLYDKLITTTTAKKRKYTKRVPKTHHITIYKLHSDRFIDATQLLLDELVTIPSSVLNQRKGKVKRNVKRKQIKK